MTEERWVYVTTTDDEHLGAAFEHERDAQSYARHAARALDTSADVRTMRLYATAEEAMVNG